ncbi:hypothetical protein [Duganella violaceipulchra]|uniref:Uncharacterized protein n=1 Tax=Duganella violaceipulchra TaxID=2849652 RepID=A0AA41H5A0_9BURK|nr:hypothetical protein [Duganella violaceicalia]MBV6321933.1 hypothetical protein [Duganella violaceicalia]MCP2007073.1 hypothetical protein [Duganella violaceicalia]
MHYTLNEVDRHHQVNINESAPPVLIPKRCVCGKAATAKQLDQHSKCVACQLADRVATLQPEDLAILRHMVGATDHHPRSRWGFRNEYLCNHRDKPSMGRLMLAGFVIAGDAMLVLSPSDLRYFHATAAGCKLAGLPTKRASVALGARP